MNQTYDWYAALIKPSFAPPSWWFVPVWSVLYVVIAVSFFRVFQLAVRKVIPAIVVAPFILNIIFNLAFSPIQFQLQNNYLASADILLVLITLIWGIISIWPYSRQLAYWQIPYLAWVSFATVLQLSITLLNQ